MNIQLFNEISKGVDQQRLINNLKGMVSISSENPFNEEPRNGYWEKEMAQFLSDSMNELGMEVESREVVTNRSNVFGRLKGSNEGATLMLAGHMDTARTDGYADAYAVEERCGRIYGRGSCDMKAGLAAYIEAVRLLKASGLRLKGTVIIAGIVDEEYQMLGSQDVGKNGPKADYGIIGEPTDLRVCSSNKGRVSTFIRTFGRAVHSSVPEQGDNAIERMGRVIQSLSGYNQFLLKQPSHPLCGQGRFNMGVIQGGVQVNMVPDCCSLEVDRRTLPGESQAKVYDELHSRIAPLVADDPNFRYEITEPSWLIPPNDIPADLPVVQSLLNAYEQVVGQKTMVSAFVAGSDAPHMGFPTVVCGPGSIGQAHSTCEFVDVEQVAKAVKMYLWTTLSLLL